MRTIILANCSYLYLLNVHCYYLYFAVCRKILICICQRKVQNVNVYYMNINLNINKITFRDKFHVVLQYKKHFFKQKLPIAKYYLPFWNFLNDRVTYCFQPVIKVVSVSWVKNIVVTGTVLCNGIIEDSSKRCRIQGLG